MNLTDEQLQTLDRYIKIRALVDRGVAGERTVAKKKAAKMERADPWLPDAFKAYQEAAKAANQDRYSSPDSASWDRMSPEQVRAFYEQIRGAPKPDKDASWGQRIGWTIFQWVAERVGDIPDEVYEELFGAEEEEMGRSRNQSRGPRRNRKKREPKLLEDWLAQEGLELELAEDAKTKEELVEIILTWPVRLLERLLSDGKDGAQVLGEYLIKELSLAVEEIEDEDDEDSEG